MGKRQIGKGQEAKGKLANLQEFGNLRQNTLEIAFAYLPLAHLPLAYLPLAPVT